MLENADQNNSEYGHFLRSVIFNYKDKVMVGRQNVIAYIPTYTFRYNICYIWMCRPE